MELEKQKLLISYLISNQELFVKVGPILQTHYFDPSVKKVVGFIKDYFDKYKSPPNPEQVSAETGAKVEVRSLVARPEIEYAANELEKFCKSKAIEHAILTSAKLLNEGKTGEIEPLIREALSVSLRREIGLEYFKDPEARLNTMLLTHKPIPTGIPKLDTAFGGGLNRQEMTVVAAPLGVGKSLTMANITRNFLRQNLNVGYITLELSELIVAKRFDSMFTGINQLDILHNIPKAAITIKQAGEKAGRLFIKRLPESATDSRDVRAYLKELEIESGVIPDVLIIDYMDLMISPRSARGENSFDKDKFVSEELRSIAYEFNQIMISASQLNRGVHSIDDPENVDPSHIAGGISKANTADNFVAIIQNALHRSRGELWFKLLKTRGSSGAGTVFQMRLNPNSLLLEDPDEVPQLQRLGGKKGLEDMVRGKVAIKPASSPWKTS